MKEIRVVARNIHKALEVADKHLSKNYTGTVIREVRYESEVNAIQK